MNVLADRAEGHQLGSQGVAIRAARGVVRCSANARVRDLVSHRQAFVSVIFQFPFGHIRCTGTPSRAP
jgi:hypothetical protein